MPPYLPPSSALELQAILACREINLESSPNILTILEIPEDWNVHAQEGQIPETLQGDKTESFN